MYRVSMVVPLSPLIEANRKQVFRISALLQSTDLALLSHIFTTSQTRTVLGWI
jgi:hypothetical protein